MVTEVLTRCVRRLGTFSPVPAEVVRGCLLPTVSTCCSGCAKRRSGTRVRANLICPWPDCGERVSIDFAIDELPVEESPDPAPMYTMTLSAQAARRQRRPLPRDHLPAAQRRRSGGAVA